MKNIMWIILTLLITTGPSFAQMTASADTDTPGNEQSFELQAANTLMDRFKNDVEDQNVGNLHVHPPKMNQKMSGYQFAGERQGNEYYQLLPRKFQNKIIRGYEIYPVAELKGSDLEEDLFIIRLARGDDFGKLYLLQAKGQKLKNRGLLSFYEKRGNTWQQVDSWIKDISRDGRLDVVRKKQVTDRFGNILKTKIKVLVMNKRGKLKENRKANIDPINYQLEQLRE